MSMKLLGAASHADDPCWMQEAAVARFREKASKWQQQCAGLLRQHEQVLALPPLPAPPTPAPEAMSE